MNEKELKKLTSLSHPKYRCKYGLFLVEGIHPVTEALRSSWDVKSLLFTKEAHDSWRSSPAHRLGALRGIPISIVSQRAFKRLSDTETPQGIMAVAVAPTVDLAGIKKAERILVADGVNDPGNLGTMIRTSVAFGFDALITTPSTVDVFGPKVVRATQGALFAMSVASHVRYEDLIPTLKSSHALYALVPRAETELRSARVARRAVLVIGAETSGVSQEMIDAADFKIRIAMLGSVESLNAAVAAAIAMYEFSLRD